jgi:hypothetical protein
VSKPWRKEVRGRSIFVVDACGSELFALHPTQESLADEIIHAANAHEPTNMRASTFVAAELRGEA